MLATTTSIHTEIALPPAPSVARRRLTGFLLQHPERARESLAAALKPLNLARIFQALFPDEYQEIVCLYDPDNARIFCDAATEKLEKLLEGWFPFEEISEGAFQIETFGGTFSWDDEDPCEFIENAEWHKNARLYWLCQMLHYGALDEEDWQKVTPIMGWPETLPAYFVTPGWRYDSDLLKERLKKAGLETVWFVWAVANNMAGNLFIDLNPYDQTKIPEEPLVTLEDILLARDEWQKAQEILKKTESADRLVADDPTILQKLVDIFNSCGIYDAANYGGNNDEPIASL